MISLKPTLRAFIGTLLFFQAAHADALSPADREALLERLEKIRSDASSRVDSRFQAAISAYRSAMASEDQALAFYLKCIEKVDYEDQKRKPADFREWKRREDARLSDVAFRKALWHQLRWLVLTLQAASENADRVALAGQAQGIVDAIFTDARALAGQQQILQQGVTGTVFARAYEIGNVRIENWPMSPVQLSQVYQQVLLPPHRMARNVTALKSGWNKRIQQELAMREHWGDGGRNNPNARGEERQRIGMASAMRSPEYDKFMADGVPALQWQMEVDLYRHGDQSGAALRMLAHLEKHIAHSEARNWGEQFQALLSAPAGAEVPAPANEP